MFNGYREQRSFQATNCFIFNAKVIMSAGKHPGSRHGCCCRPFRLLLPSLFPFVLLAVLVAVAGQWGLFVRVPQLARFGLKASA